jgi:sulfur carrier protein
MVEMAPLTPQLEGLTGLLLPAGATVFDALEALAMRLSPEVRLGVWGHTIAATEVLSDGDRIEFYRPLKHDPKVARQARVARRGR